MTDLSKEWERWGAQDPYFAVLSTDRFRRENLSSDALREFFASGEERIEAVFKTIRRRLHPDFSPRRALEFGCGTGRLLIPLAGRCAEVVGVDVSGTMLAEAEKNCRQHALSNVEFVKVDYGLTGLRGQYDLLIVSLVFQHIPRGRGRRLLSQLLDHLSPGGIAVLDFIYHRDVARWRKLLAWIRQRSRIVHTLVNVAQRRNVSDPLIQMNVYSLNSVLIALHGRGVQSIFCEFAEHPNHYRGVVLYCRRG